MKLADAFEPLRATSQVPQNRAGLGLLAKPLICLLKMKRTVGWKTANKTLRKQSKGTNKRKDADEDIIRCRERVVSAIIGR